MSFVGSWPFSAPPKHAIHQQKEKLMVCSGICFILPETMFYDENRECCISYFWHPEHTIYYFWDHFLLFAERPLKRNTYS